MKIILIPIFIIVLSSLVFAEDLSDYPDYFVVDDRLDVVLVVGDKAPVTHVIAQTQIALSLSQLVTQRSIGLSKLASDLKDIDQNIISMGNACDNEVTAQILSNPQPCDKNLDSGKATIELYEKDGNIHIILNTFSDEGIKKAADVLSNYENYDLEGNIFEIEVEEVESIELSKQEVEEETEEIEEAEIATEKVQEVNEEETVDKEQTIEQEEKAPEPIFKEEDNLIKKFISWFLSLFR